MAAICAGACALLGGGCGGVRAADLFLVERAGPAPQERLTLLVNEEGGVRCNGGPQRRLSDAQLIEARTIQEGLHTPASRHLQLPPRQGSVFSYRVRDVDGSLSFADNSAGQTHALSQLSLFVLRAARQLCRLPQ